MVRSFLGEMSTEPRNRTYKASGCDGFPGTLHQIPLYLILGISLGPVDFSRKAIVFQLVIKKRRFEKNPFYQMVRSFLGEMSTEPRNRTYKDAVQVTRTASA